MRLWRETSPPKPAATLWKPGDLCWFESPTVGGALLGRAGVVEAVSGSRALVKSDFDTDNVRRVVHLDRLWPVRSVIVEDD